MRQIIELPERIQVDELADRLGVKPFRVISDLIKLRVFVSSVTKEVEFEVAARICGMHGFGCSKES
jgi:translation initiation factor IF-2